MSTTFPDGREIERRIRRAGRRFGYLLAAAINLGLLWIVHHLLGWGWPGFLTDDFDELLPITSVSLVVSAAANLVYAWDDRGAIKHAGDLVTSVLGLIGSIWAWQVFPFDLSDGWRWLARTAIVVGIVGSAVGAVVALVKLVRDATGAANHPSH
jgi:hypothetical protein